MVKSIIKEIVIILLLLIALILALGVLFYDYIPNNKTVPSVLTYKTSDSLSREITEQIVEEEPVLLTYEITSDDLKSLENTNDYNRGKVNPFSTYEDPEPNTEDENNGTGVNSISGNVNTSSGNASSGNTNRNNNTSNTFYKNTGTK